jgi:hypothetical protein
MKFVEATKNEIVATLNDMPAYKNTSNVLVDFFSKAGTMRGQDIIPLFVPAYVENTDYALRLALWLRDIRLGCGERELFKNILLYLANNHEADALRLFPKIPELGRWDDGLIFLNTPVEDNWFEYIQVILSLGIYVRDINNKDGDFILNKFDESLILLTLRLCPNVHSLLSKEEIAILLDKINKDDKIKVIRKLFNIILSTVNLLCKWTPRKGYVAFKIAKNFGISIKALRKTLVSFTTVVEQLMSDNRWDDINFSHVPSKAISLYKKAFKRHTENYAKYLESLLKKDKNVKVNVGAIYPHEILKDLDFSNFYVKKSITRNLTKEDKDLIKAQWDALPNYVNDNKVLPLVDVSGSMFNTYTTPIPICVAVSLGLYFSEKNTGEFKDLFLTFSHDPEFVLLRGNIIQRIDSMITSSWSMNTSLEKALLKILKVAIENKVDNEDMPNVLLILSDMQFDVSIIRSKDNAQSMIEREYEKYGYRVPKTIYWNLRDYGNSPCKFDKNGVALVSGFNPAILKSVLSCDILDPYKTMMNTIMNKRYDIV